MATVGEATADGGETSASAAESWRTPWSATSPSVVEHVRAGMPLVVRVVVPLCSNEQIDCGSTVAGHADKPSTNLYWGAAFGVRRHFDRLEHVWERVSVTEPTAKEPLILQRAVYRRFIAGSRWQAAQRVEQLVVLEAVHGEAIRDAAARFWTLAVGGDKVRLVDGDRVRTETVQVVGYAGHNELSPGYRQARRALRQLHPQPISAFALGCQTQAHAAERLHRHGVDTLITTRQNMAPEGYVVDAIVRALGDNASRSALRARTVASYARFQRIPATQASWVFAR